MSYDDNPSLAVLDADFTPAQWARFAFLAWRRDHGHLDADMTPIARVRDVIETPWPPNACESYQWPEDPGC